ncbi:Rv2231c family pyridoxal phosphate-dependent protein CobC [Streptomyces filamentosus]|uniref:Rv2231c family pyridoxal phosphate-dependent protein CobC n=1 Tax=Streptomyces filamentosus TaxID=67294 RepID=UPI001238D2A6|nr:Rv2231c family pyridoxal phosphate-dependent protein CobC [Streptomyces filamentosus]KAA6220231.1 threonine-phosphate decarboxylase [Streptomyces filamentosus]
MHVGVGVRSGATAREVLELVRGALAEAGGVRVRGLATLDARAGAPGIVAAAGRLGVPVTGFPAEVLAGVVVPHPSEVPLAASGTASVAEAAALVAAGPGAVLVVPKRKSRRVTCAIAASVPVRPDEVTSVARLSPLTRGYIAGEPDSPHISTPTPHTTADMDTHTEGPPTGSHAHDLRHHGDAEVRDEKLTDLAVNVRTATPPDWLRERIARSLFSLAAYPDGRSARAAVAERHDLPPGRVLLTSGAAEAFVLLARALPVRRPVVVHPQFTEPEAALRDAGHEVRRVLLREEDGFRLDPAAVPEDADLVVVGNPTNPTSVLHPAEALAALARPGRYLVVDEAFMDAVPGERESLAGRTDLPGLIVLRSLTKTWGLAGLRIGYVLAGPETVALLERAQPLWPVSTPALVAAEACMSRAALAEAEHAAHRIGVERAHLLAGLAEFDEVRTVPAAEGPFVLIRTEGADAVRERLRLLGFAVRRGDTFPGLDRHWLRLAVRDRVTTNRFLQALDQALLLGG